MKKKSVFITLFSLSTCLASQAQEYATDKSIREQVVNNKQAGVLYAPVAQKGEMKEKGFAGSSLVRAIKDGKMGMPVTNSAPAADKGTSVNEKKTENKLPSEISAEEAKAAAANELRRAPVATIPHQNEEKTEKIKKEN